MISISTKDKLISLSELKSQIQSIIKNIQALEELKNAQVTAVVAVEKQHQLINDTNVLFSALEVQTQNRKLLKRLKKRRNKRRRQKQKKQETRRSRKIVASIIKANKNTNLLAAAIGNDTTEAIVNAVPKTDTAETTATEVLHQQPVVENEFFQLKNYNNAQRFLKTFELLEMLHYTRSQDKILTLQFHEQFANLRCVWNNILMENKPKRTAECRIEDQWNETFFGVKEQTYYDAANKKSSERERLRKFLCIRRTWDSYLVRQKKHGSCIPAGWVLPKIDATDMWAKYRTTL